MNAIHADSQQHAGARLRREATSHDAWSEPASHAGNRAVDRPAPRDAATEPLVSAPQMLIAMFVAPLAWLVEMAIAQTQATSDCLAGGRFASIALPWTPLTVALANFICLALAAFGTAVAWRNLRRTTRMSWRSNAEVKGTRAESDWFLSRVSAIFSTMFGFGLVATGVGAALISPCSQWW
jgi:hypothetical protein